MSKYNEIKASSLLRIRDRTDSYFLSNYGMNIYRGCSHACIYCDGRDDKYYGPENFEEDISVKINAAEILEREINPARKRKARPSSYIVIGGGVGDAYQKAEETYKITRECLKVISSYQKPIHILTKSVLVKRDFDIIKEIANSSSAILSVSISTVCDNLASFLEPGCPSPSQRLGMLKEAKACGINTGVFLMPIIPFLSDSPLDIDKAVSAASSVSADFIVFGGLTLKDGRQKDFFMRRLLEKYPSLHEEYIALYSNKDSFGSPHPSYAYSAADIFLKACLKYKIPARMPPRLFKNILSESAYVCIMLEYLDYFYGMSGKKSPYGYAAYSISKLPNPIREYEHNLRDIKGVGYESAKIITALLNSRAAGFYRSFPL